ncbi:MAG: GNAT family N-acetyltransferase, partial [Pseudomonadota bacterium]
SSSLAKQASTARRSKPRSHSSAAHTGAPMLVIEKVDPGSPGPRALLEASHKLMEELFPPEDNHYLSIEALRASNIQFFQAREGTTTLGTGALATMGDYGEVKSMFTAPEARCKGVAAALLRQIEDAARETGLSALKLETGNSLHAALALYERHGFAPCAPFGAYEANETSVFYEKTL